jgi:hypothetical protein
MYNMSNPAKMTRGKRIFFGRTTAKNKTYKSTPNTRNSVLTRAGNSGLKNTIIKGIVMKTDIIVDVNMVVVTTSGIDLINSPMIPVERRSGTKPQIVVIAEDQSGTIKSFHTIIPV